MATYHSNKADGTAVFLYFKFSWFVSLVTYGLFLAVCAYAHIVTIPMILFLIACQNITWLIGGFCMLVAYKSLTLPPLPPKEKEKVISESNKVSGKTNIKEIIREKTYKYQ